MENAIRDGTLRLLESTCDVILSCQGRRLMAHKVMLSLASPIFRNLLLEDLTAPTVIILPDISSHIMSLLLDYIYSGSVMVYSNTLQQFLGLASLFEIKLDYDFNRYQKPREKCLPNRKEEFKKIIENEASKNENKQNNEDLRSKKTLKKLPQLIPINRVRPVGRSRVTKSINSCILPSPWRSRVETIYGNPRDDIIDNSEHLIPSHTEYTKLYENDSNNNFQIPIFSRYHQNRNLPTSDQYSPKINSPIAHFFPNLNQVEKAKNGLLNNTITRPPEDVAIDRDKPKINNDGKSPNIKNWMTSNLETFQKTEVNLPETNLSSHTPSQVKESVSIKEESSDSNQDYESESISAVEKRQKCSNSGLEYINNKEKPFKCDKCGKSFSQLRNFKYHRSIHAGTKEFAAKCLECGKIFNDKGYLSSHMKIHRDKKEYACPHCPKRFNQRVAYNMHLRIHTGVKPHECPTCKKSFSRKMLLKQHQRVHTGERPYSCPECGKTFADRSNMSLHARLHTGVKPYACNLCPKSFTKKHHLKTHMNFHTGLKPYTCEKCGLAFSQSSNMRTHYKKCLLKHQLSQNQALSEENEENKNTS